MFYFLFLEPFHFLDFSDEFFYVLLFKWRKTAETVSPF